MAKSPGGREVGRVSIRALPNTSDFKADLKTQLDAIEKATKLTIQVGLDLDKARSDLKKFQTEIASNQLDLDVDADTAEADAKIKETARKRKVPLSLSVDSASLAKVKATLLALAAKNPLTGLVKSLPKISALSLGIAGIGSVALTAVRGLGGIITQLGELSPLVSLLPGLFIGAGLGVATLVVALKDAPAHIGSTLTAFKSLKGVIDKNFWSPATAPIKELLSSLLPQLKLGFGGLASSLGVSIGSIATTFKGAFSGGILTSLFADVSAGVKAATPGLNSFASAFVSLLGFGTSYLPAFGGYVSRIGAEFNNWLTGVEASGELNDAIKVGLGLLHDLAGVGKDVASIFHGIFLSGNGVDPFGALDTGLAAVAKVVNSPGFQTALATIFTGASEGASELAVALGPIGNMFAKLAPTIASILATSGATLGLFLGNVAKALSSPAFSKGLSDFFSGIQTGLLAIGPSLPALAGALGSLGTFVGDLAAQVGPILGQALQSLAPVFTDLLTAIEPILPILGQTLISAIQQFAPLLPGIIKSIAPLLPQLATFVQDLLPQLVLDMQIAAPIIELVALQLTGFFTVLNLILRPFAQLLGLTEALLNGGQPLALLLDALHGKFGILGQGIAGFSIGMAQVEHAISTGFLDMVNGIIYQLNGLISVWNGFAAGVKSLTGGSISLKIGKIPNVAVPKAATGMTVAPRPGGTLVNMSEAGKTESIVDTGKVNEMIYKVVGLLAGSSGKAGAVVNQTNNFSVPDADPRLLARQMGREVSTALAGT